jgi:hypothetical protein
MHGAAMQAHVPPDATSGRETLDLDTITHLAQVRQEVGLVLHRICRRAQRGRASSRVPRHAGVVSRGHAVEGPGVRAFQVLQEGAKLDPAGDSTRSDATNGISHQAGCGKQTLRCTHAIWAAGM